MKRFPIQFLIGLCSMTFLFGCSDADDYKPVGRWEATGPVNVYQTSDHPLVVAFTLEKGDVCAISEEVLIRKDLGYSKIACSKGGGWVISGDFKRLSD